MHALAGLKKQAWRELEAPFVSFKRSHALMLEALEACHVFCTLNHPAKTHHIQGPRELEVCTKRQAAEWCAQTAASVQGPAGPIWPLLEPAPCCAAPPVQGPCELVDHYTPGRCALTLNPRPLHHLNPVVPPLYYRAHGSFRWTTTPRGAMPR